MNQPDLSVVIPVYDRGALVRHTLASVRAASAGLRVETVVVDDGSRMPLAGDLARLGISVDLLIRQENRGLLFARLAGLDAATGRNVLFLDSDDLVSADKLRTQVAALDVGADVAYTDHAGQALDDETGPAGQPDAHEPLPVASSAAGFFITVQPAPHSPAFRTDYLRARVAAAPFPPSPLYNAVAEIWFYHICAPFPARVVKCPGLALVGRHPGPRLTNHWEKLGVASLAVQEAFARTCPLGSPEGREARALAAAKTFLAWRRLPRGFSAEFSRRLLAIWKHSPAPAEVRLLGGKSFLALARLLGAERAARLLHRFQAGPYSACRTLDDNALEALLARLPPP